MPFLAKGKFTYKGHVRGSNGRRVIRSLDVRDPKLAKKIEVRIHAWHADKRWDVLDAIVAGRLTPHEAYVSELRNELPNKLAVSSVPPIGPDLDPWVDRWVTEDTPRPRTVDMVRRFIPAGTPFPLAQFSRPAIKTFLGTLKDQRASLTEHKMASGGTKNRYLSALSVFVTFLQGHTVLDDNPLEDVRRFKESGGRTIFYERADQKRLVATLPYVAAALEALMMAAGLEWQVLARLCARDIDLKAMTVVARGSKNYWRNRTVRIADAWSVPYIRKVLKGKLPGDLVFPDIRPESSLALHIETCEALGLERTTLHDARHSFAVQKLRDGWPVSLVAHNLGHQDAYMVFKRYGRFVPNMTDFDHFAATTLATPLATPPRSRVK